MGGMSREKGKRGEREFAEYLRERGLRARRGQQFSGGPGSPDVLSGIDHAHFEVKRVETLRLHDALAQAIADAGPEDTPVVAYRRNRGEWVAILPMDHLIALFMEADRA